MIDRASDRVLTVVGKQVAVHFPSLLLNPLGIIKKLSLKSYRQKPIVKKLSSKSYRQKAIVKNLP